MLSGGDLSRRPTDAGGDTVDLREVIRRPVSKTEGAVRNKVFAWHNSGSLRVG